MSSWDERKSVSAMNSALIRTVLVPILTVPGWYEAIEVSLFFHVISCRGRERVEKEQASLKEGKEGANVELSSFFHHLQLALQPFLHDPSSRRRIGRMHSPFSTVSLSSLLG